LPEHAPSVHTSRAPSAAGISWRGADGAGRATFAGRPVVVASPVQPACAHVPPDRAISSPGWMRDEQTPQVVANFAVIGTPTP
jgi:hypothetical protein